MIESNASNVVAAFRTLIGEIEAEINQPIEHADQVKACHDKVVSLYEEWRTLHYYESWMVTHTKPTTVSILGSSFRVRSWRDVLKRTMNTVIERRSGKFEQLTKRLPHIVGPNSIRFITPWKLNNDTYIEVNLQASEIVRRCSQILKEINSSPEDSIIVTIPRGNKTLTITILSKAIYAQSYKHPQTRHSKYSTRQQRGEEVI